MKELVTVVMPVYNATRFLGAALDSVFAQTERPLEVIVVDDASRDGTTDMVEAIAATAPVPIRLIRLAENSGGPATPLNTAIAAASTDLIALLEQDDLMAASRLSVQAAAALRFPECGLVAGRLAIVTGEGEHERWEAVPAPSDIPQYAEHASDDSFVVPSDVAFRSLMKANFIYSNSNVMLRKSAFTRVGGFDPRWPINADADFEFRMLTTSPIAVANTLVCGYRSRGDSLYHARQKKARIDGLLIRLKWGSRQWPWASREAQSVYWALRADVSSLLREGDYKTAARVVKALATSGVARRHVVSKFTRGSTSAFFTCA
jgi:glycosyltransferase involved in cell wall biosynthesis